MVLNLGFSAQAVDCESSSVVVNNLASPAAIETLLSNVSVPRFVFSGSLYPQLVALAEFQQRLLDGNSGKAGKSGDIATTAESVLFTISIFQTVSAKEHVDNIRPVISISLANDFIFFPFS